jgi:hypothetical protein
MDDAEKLRALTVEVSWPRHMLHTITSGRSGTQSAAALKSRWAIGRAVLSPGYYGAFVFDPSG